jgi:hypothetical protein
VFDWTVLETVHGLLLAGAVKPQTKLGRRLILAATTDKTERQIPRDRAALWDDLLSWGAVEIGQQPAGTYFGQARRQLLSSGSDLLLIISGGAGVEHLADTYSMAGKPTVPFDLHLGASVNDGRGGGAAMSRLVASDHTAFFRLRDQARAGQLARAIRTEDGKRGVQEVVAGLTELIDALSDPRIFYVRLLNPAIPEFRSVETFFRKVVDPVVIGLGYQPYQAGRELSDHSWMNVEIFSELRQSAGSVVDLTGARLDCYAEFGYLLGLPRMVIVTARLNSQVSFDFRQFETHFWKPRGVTATRQMNLLEYWYRMADRPPLFRPSRSTHR